jgi:hypothetical protein
MAVTIPENLKVNTKYTIESSNPSILTQFTDTNGADVIYKLVSSDPQPTVEYFKSEPVDEEILEGAVSTSDNISAVTGPSASVSDALAFLGVVLSAD